LKYSPEEIQFYLIDLKKGVGFKPYSDARLPHAKVIAIDSEREFALSVLRGLINEMDNRGDIFRNYSVDSIKAFREKTQEKIPRILLVVDEFQNLFLEDDPVSRESSYFTWLTKPRRESLKFIKCHAWSNWYSSCVDV
jgi:DNA segregation ATPase FtsK/SpoIIIE, S-DNA-T family